MTRRQAEWLRAVRGYYARTGLSPTLRQLCEAMGLGPTSTGAAASALRTLAEKGYLAATKIPGGHTRYVPADRGIGPVEEPVAGSAGRERPVALRMRGYAARYRGRLVPGTIGATARSATEAARRREGCASCGSARRRDGRWCGSRCASTAARSGPAAERRERPR